MVEHGDGHDPDRCPDLPRSIRQPDSHTLFGNGKPYLARGTTSSCALTVSFDLFVIRSWDGNSTDAEGPDVWTASVSGGPTLLNTTFNTGAAYHAAYGQAYPGSYPGGMYPPRTGAIENNTLGYLFVGPDYNGIMDSVYSISISFPHSSAMSRLILRHP